MKRVLLALPVLALIFASGAQAAAVYDNTGDSTDGRDDFVNQGPILGDSFSTGSPFHFTELKLVLQAGEDLNDHTLPLHDGKTINVDLYSGNGTAGPLTFLDTLFSVSDDALNLSATPIDQVLSTPIDLAGAGPGSYWIVLSTPDGSTAGWSYTLASDPGTAGEYFFTGTMGFDLAQPNADANGNSNGPHQMAVIGTVRSTGGSSVPEPLTLSLFGAGLVGAAALRRGKKSA